MAVVGGSSVGANTRLTTENALRTARPHVDSVSTPGRTRTCDPLIKSQMLYRLSYGRIPAALRPPN